MRRCLLVFLLFVAPLQIAWGAAAQYCGHDEQACSQAHVGHHEHRHAASAGDDPVAEGLLAHADCASCHLGCTVLPALSLSAGDASARGGEPPGARMTFESHIPIGPERRDRSDAAAAVRSGVGVAFGRLLIA